METLFVQFWAEGNFWSNRPVSLRVFLLKSQLLSNLAYDLFQFCIPDHQKCLHKAFHKDLMMFKCNIHNDTIFGVEFTTTSMNTWRNSWSLHEWAPRNKMQILIKNSFYANLKKNFSFESEFVTSHGMFNILFKCTSISAIRIKPDLPTFGS